MNEFLARALEMKDEILSHRRALHQIPELGMDLPQTTAYVMDSLRSIGLDPVEICRCGVVCTIGSGERTILLRADMDALPVEEKTGLPFASHNGNMHACGHDCHAAMLLSAAKMLKEREDELCGVVKLMFQPGEETLEGSKAMLNAGLLESPKVDAAFAMHVGVFYDETESGCVTYTTGRMGSHATELWVTLRRPAGNRANLIDVASLIALSMQELAGNEVQISQPNIEIFNSFECDNESPGALPNRVVFKGVIISLADDVQQYVDERVNEIISRLAAAFGVEYEVYYAKQMLPMDGNAQFAAEIHPYIEEVTGAGKTKHVANSWLKGGVDDFAAISMRVPSQYMSLGCGSAAEGYTVLAHKDNFVINEDVLPIGAAVYANIAYSWLRDAQRGKEGAQSDA